MMASQYKKPLFPSIEHRAISGLYAFAERLEKAEHKKRLKKKRQAFDTNNKRQLRRMNGVQK